MAGFALRRNGSCLSSETECNPTVAPFYACCPFGSVCSNHYNQVCCPTTTNCTSDTVDVPVCGDSSWTLFDNGGVAGGYFCCLGGQIGYSVEGASDGCASSGYVLQSGESELESISYARSNTTSSSSVQATPNTSIITTIPSAPTTITSTNPPPVSATKPSADTRGIIGGVVGGTLAAIAIICVVVVCMYRKRRRAQTAQPPRSPGPTELFAGRGPMELIADKKQPKELFAYNFRSPQSPKIAAELDISTGRDILEKYESYWRVELPDNRASNDE